MLQVRWSLGAQNKRKATAADFTPPNKRAPGQPGAENDLLNKPAKRSHAPRGAHGRKG